MSASLLHELLSEYSGALPDALTTPAKAANSAKSVDLQGLKGASATCEGLRISANAGACAKGVPLEFAGFANVRSLPDPAETQQIRASSQDSQDSQACLPTNVSAPTLAAVAWTDEDIARFAEREARLLRWGWPAAEAEAMAERLVLRDRQRDDRVSCTECDHYRPGRCGNHRAADLHAPLVARDMAALLQRCGGFEPLHGGVVRPPG